jgi:hypothetical protein
LSWEEFSVSTDTLNPKEKDWNAVGIEAVLQSEEIEIARLCRARGASDRFNPDEKLEVPSRLGLAFSGGGIRSASVNLGLLQSFARSGILKQAHYISGISGGGYILGWLTAWIARVGFRQVNAELGENSNTGQPAPTPRPNVYDRYLEPNPIHFLRRYVSYLVPRSGLGSGDTLAAAAIYLRDLLLVQSLVVFAVVGLLAFGQLWAPVLLWTWLSSAAVAWIALCIVGFSGTLLAASIGRSLGNLARNEVSGGWFATGGTAEILSVILCITIWLGLPSLFRRFSTIELLIAVAISTIASLLLGWISAAWKRKTSSILKAVGVEGETLIQILSSLLAGALGGALVFGMRSWLIANATQVTITNSYVILGLPALFAGFALISFLYVGFRGDSMPDAKREWFGRLAGYYFYFAIIAAIFLSVALLGPPLFDWIFKKPHTVAIGIAVKWLLPGGWIFTTASGLFAAHSPSTGKNGKNSAMEVLAATAPPLFLVGIMLLASYGTHAIAHRIVSFDYLGHGQLQVVRSPDTTPSACYCCNSASCKPATTSIWTTSYPSNGLGQAAGRLRSFNLITKLQTRITNERVRAAGILFLMGALALLLLSILSRRVSVNEFSLHLFYRNRLVRTFLGASNLNREAKSNRFTGFALDDDLPLGSLQQDNFDGPYPIWGTSLNLTSGEDLAWQKRKASSFIYSPLFCGWDYFSPGRVLASGLHNLGYRAVAARTQDGEGDKNGYGGEFGAPFIGTAMAASGAAISPNWGYHTKPAIAALLAVFNIRIGWWTGNTRSDKGSKLYAPKAGYFLKELLGATGQDGDFVYLSDGGHFENLGIYELVRRRVRYIIACDADADPTYGFGDLANAVEKCRVDFGVQIHMAKYSSIAPKKDGKNSTVHYAIGIIDYLPAQGDHSPQSGVLLYIKSSLTGDEEAQVLGQKAIDVTFPHDTTLNQFFNETQFEAYRELGEHLGLFLWNQFLSASATTPKESLNSEDESRRKIRDFFEEFLRKEWKNAREPKQESEYDDLIRTLLDAKRNQI